MSARLIILLGLIYAGFSALGIAAGVSIVRKAGYSPWWVVTGFVPLVNVVMVFTFAFADWPILQENRREHRLRAAENKGHPSFGYPGPAVLPTAVLPTASLPAEPAEEPAPLLYDPAAAVALPPPMPPIPTYPQHRATPSSPIAVSFIAHDATATEPYGT